MSASLRQGKLDASASPSGPVPPVAQPDGALPRHLARDALRRRLLAGADALAVLGAAGIAVAGALSTTAGLAVLAVLPAFIVLAKLHDLYDRDHRALRHLTVDELGRIVSWATAGTAFAAAVIALTTDDGPGAFGAGLLWLGLVILAPALRGGARVLWRKVTPPTAVMPLGSGPLERATRRKLELFEDMHVQVVGRLDDGALASVHDDAALERQVLDACGGRLPDRVIVCTQAVHERVLADVVRFCRARRIKLSVVPPLRGMFGTAVRLAHVAELPLVEYHTGDASTSTLMLKRWCDVVVAAVGLVLTAPLLVLAAIAIKLESRGPVLYRQQRAGLDQRPFRMLKFRTMAVDSDARLPELVTKLRDDPRVTRVGRVLRRWSLDELPQLVNVLRGEMSLVGPRPEELALVELYRPEHRFRLEAVPGLTGPMQVYGRAALALDERLAVEREYIENISLGRDLKILLLTFPAVLSGKGAY